MSDKDIDQEVKDAEREYRGLRELLGSRKMFGEDLPDFTQDIPEPKPEEEKLFEHEPDSLKNKYDHAAFMQDKEYLD